MEEKKNKIKKNVIGDFRRDKDPNIILKMSSEERRKYLIEKHDGKKSPITRVKSKDRIKFDRKSIIEFGIKHKIKTQKQLREMDSLTSPNYRDILKHFETWKNFIDEINPEKMFMRGIDNIAEYIIKVMISRNLWTTRDWNKASRGDDTIPSIETLKKEFVYFTEAVRVARNYSIDICFKSYLEIVDRVGRIPKQSDIDEHGINISVLIDRFGSKEKLDERVVKILKIDEDKKRN